MRLLVLALALFAFGCEAERPPKLRRFRVVQIGHEGPVVEQLVEGTYASSYRGCVEVRNGWDVVFSGCGNVSVAEIID